MSRTFVVAVGKGFRERQAAARDGAAPRHDMAALADHIGAELIGYDQVPDHPSRKSLALYALDQTADDDLIFSYSEDVTALILCHARLRLRRPRIVTVGHSLGPSKKLILHKRLWSRSLLAMLVFSEHQASLAQRRLGFAAHQILVTPNWTDHQYFHPGSDQDRSQGPVVAIGGEHRDYPTLISAAHELPVETSMGSYWARTMNVARSLPSNVNDRRRDWPELRSLYQRASAVVVPLMQCDFPAGITSIIEGMACGAPLIITRTKGLEGVLPPDSVLWVEPGDPDAMRQAIDRVRGDRELAQRLGRAGRAYVERAANLDRWIETVRIWVAHWQAAPAASPHAMAPARA